MYLNEVGVLVHQLNDRLVLLLVLHVERLDRNLWQTEQLLEGIVFSEVLHVCRVEARSIVNVAL